MKVSVIVPVYNVEDYLEECLESLINQTLKDIEIICINDGSTDLSEEVLNKYGNNYKNICIINQQNQGLSVARNMGIEIARGEYIYFLDSDDYIETECLETCYNEAKKNILDMVIFDAVCFLDKKYNGNEVNENYDRSNIHNKVVSGKEFYILSNKKKCYKAPVWLNFYKTEFLKKNQLFFINGIIHEDEIHTCEGMLKAERVKYISEKFYKRRIRNNSIMTSTIKKDSIVGYFQVVRTIYELYNQSIRDSEYELAEIILDNIRLFLNIAIAYCDMLNEFELKKAISKYIYDNKKILNPELDIKINSPVMSYNKGIVKINRQSELLLYSGVKKIFYMLLPCHGNLGDQAIVYATIRFLQDTYPSYKVIKINYEETYLYIDIIKQISNENDFVVLPGGGNMGNHYVWEEEARRYIISNITDLPIISFPQTIYFSPDNSGKEQLEITQGVYNKNQNLTLVAREDISFNIMKKNFTNCNVIKYPDIVFYLNNKLELKNEKIDREYITTCFRVDKESYYDMDKKYMLKKMLSNKYTVIETDTVVPYKVNSINRDEELFKIWREFYKSKVVITDRLHGMIFAAVTKTPCIVLRSYDYKITESYKWIKDLNYIRFLDDFNYESIEAFILEVQNLKEFTNIDFDIMYFDDLKYYAKNINTKI